MFRMKYRAVVILLLCLPILSCNDDDDQDMEYPVIIMNSGDASPLNCAVIYRGESFPFKAIFTDNQELGSYNIEIHNNFDHHSHSTENEECELDSKKEPVNPFIYNKDYVIPTGETYFAADNIVEVPADVDTGDYHFMIRLTDKAGWQALKAVSIKIRDKNE
ncbi:MAG: DUF4625 domain-containing protein [Clostridiaceae bacterium]|nr:DUF4625 domain-containing protein [Clostridiaceae bacterium]